MLSVVIPAYNAEKYIDECIKSVLEQPAWASFVKLVVVVDGATDDTYTLALRACRGQEGRARVLLHENEGASAARNMGLSLVDTEYVTFLDADDAWCPDYLDTVMPILASKPDLLEYDAYMVGQNGLEEKVLKIGSAKDGSTVNIDKYDFLEVFRCYCWARVYRTSDVRKHPFPPGRRFEDTATTPWFYWNAKAIISVGKPLVRYRQHSLSILATPSGKDIYELAECIRESVTRYNETLSPFWFKVSYRIHNFTCDRILRQHFSSWVYSSRVSRRALEGAAPKSFVGVIQYYFTILYIVLMKVKRIIW